MGEDKSYLRDLVYQKAKVLLGKMEARKIIKQNAKRVEAGLPSIATEEQRAAFKYGRGYAFNQKQGKK